MLISKDFSFGQWINDINLMQWVQNF